MSKPLFTDEEIAELGAKLRKIEKLYNRKKPGQDFNTYWAEKQAVQTAHEVETVMRAQARIEEFLAGLLLLVGHRGAYYIPFKQLFAESDSKEITTAVLQHDTPEVRRSLYTILRALTEVPRSWGMSAFCRFLRGTGKQAGAKYHGAGAFGTSSGWKAKEIQALCSILVSDHSYITGYATCLMSYDDVHQEVRQAMDEDFEIEHDTQFKATRVTRDVEFLNKLCEILEKRGLAEVPRPLSKSPPKARKPKVFKSGDVIRTATIRDLPLPAHVRIPILRQDKDSDVWVEAHLEHVVLRIKKDGRYNEAKVAKTGVAYEGTGRLQYGVSKSWLNGAVYLGPWTGKIEKKDLNYKFRYRERDS